MPRVVLCMPELGVTKRGWEQCKEIYVMSFSSDLQLVNGPRVTDAIAAYNETLPNVASGIGGQALMKYIVMAVSNTFARIEPDQPPSLSGSGIILYPPQDPKGMLANHFVIVEDDEGKRNLGKLLDNLFNDKNVKEIVAELMKNFTEPLVGQLFNLLTTTLPSILKKNKDDFLFAHSHSGFDWDNYGCGPGTHTTDFKLHNDRAYCTLRVMCVPDA